VARLCRLEELPRDGLPRTRRGGGALSCAGGSCSRPGPGRSAAVARGGHAALGRWGRPAASPQALRDQRSAGTEICVVNWLCACRLHCKASVPWSRFWGTRSYGTQGSVAG